MPNSDLLAYVESQRARGVVDGDIRQAAATAGWSDELLNEVFLPSDSTISNPTTPPAPAIPVSAPVAATDLAPTTPLAITSTPTTPATTSSRSTESASAQPLALKIAALLTYTTAGILIFQAGTTASVVGIIASTLRRSGLTLSILETSATLTQLPFVLGGLGVVLLWLGRGIWVGVAKLAKLALLVLPLAIGSLVFALTQLAADFNRLAGDSLTTFSVDQTKTMWLGIATSPALLGAAAAFLAVIVALPKTNSQPQPLSLRAKIILSTLSTLVLGPILALSLLVAVWTVDTDLGAKELQPVLNYQVHKLPSSSNFVMETHFTLAKTIKGEPEPAVQAAVIPKSDARGEVGKRRSIVFRQYPKTADINPSKALNFDPQGQTETPKLVALGSGQMAAMVERQFGQGKITSLAFEAPDGVMIRLSSIKAQLPELIQLADELNKTPPTK